MGALRLSPELRDTFQVYGVPDGLRLAWLDEARFLHLPRDRRAALVRAQRTHDRELVPSVRAWAPLLGDRVRGQADGHRFVWWPSLLADHRARVLTEFVEEGRRASRHDEVPQDVWDAASAALPAARRIAGTFPEKSGPNCFGAVMAAAGVASAATVWMQREPFEHWLSTRTRPGGHAHDLGTVLVWRSPDGRVQHAAVALGGGWVLHKPSQGWMSPTKVLRAEETRASARARGRVLERRHLVG